MKRANRLAISTATTVFIAATLLVGATVHAGATSVFVTIDNPGNDAASAKNTSHGYSDAYGYGRVDYVYEISQTAVSIAEWEAFYNDEKSQKAGSFESTYDYWNVDVRNVGDHAPAVNISFHQAAQYVNWLTTGDATSGVYTIDSSGYVTGTKSRQDALEWYGVAYFIPTEDEWYKAAYYDPTKNIGNGETGGYWLYAHRSDEVPERTTNDGTGWNYTDSPNAYEGYALTDPDYVWTVDTGTAEQNGTRNMMGNVWEWCEPIPNSKRGLRGGSYFHNEEFLRASFRGHYGKTTVEDKGLGFRVARVTPEPGGVGAMMGMAAVGFLCFWRRR